VSAGSVGISVVIPALDEAEALPRALESTKAPGVERIVVDGGSRDDTLRVAHACGAERVLATPPGRARQMDEGYRASRGEVVLFLHADSRLEPGWDAALRRALADPDTAGGAFRLAFDAPGALWRILELGVRLRCRIGGYPYGDQGVFARRALLEAIGGIAPTEIFEDLDLVRAIRARGRLALLPERVVTSARRYQRNGVVSTLLRHQAALAAFALGLDRAAVAAWYRRRPSR
jgi:rSAM/selenodomain-associated transferase 2